MSSVAVIDYGMGNIDSVVRAVEMCGGTPVLTCENSDLQTATHIILPGVGSYQQGMDRLNSLSLAGMLEEQVIGNRIPFLGICLGMQFLAATGFEGGETAGLGWIGGRVVKIVPESTDERIPHVGWNEVLFDSETPLFDNIPSGKDFYFVHSYHFVCDNPSHVLATTPYGGGVVSAVGRDNIFGVQFHPEKSQKRGFQILKNFLAMS
jgi:glutamine amidotransferase